MKIFAYTLLVAISVSSVIAPARAANKKKARIIQNIKPSKPKYGDDIPEEVLAHIYKLESDMVEERAIAAFQLGEMGAKATSAIPYLIRRLDDKDKVQWSVVPGDFTRMIKRKVSAIVAEALVKIGEHDPQPLINVLRNHSELVRTSVVEALGLLGDKRVFSALVVMTNDESPAVKIKTAKALEQLNDPMVFEALISLLNDKDEKVRKVAEDALHVVDENWHDSEAARRAIPGLVIVLRGSSEEERKVASHALTMIDPDWRQSENARLIVPELIETLKSGGKLVRRNSAWVLGMIRDPSSVTPLIAALDDTDEITRVNAALALGVIKDPSALSALVAMLMVKDREAQAKVHSALREIDSDWRNNDEAKKAIPRLTMSLFDDDKDVRRQVGKLLATLGWKPSNEEEKVGLLVAKLDWKSLIMVGKPAAVKPLINRLKDADNEVRKQAAWALGRIKAKKAVRALITVLKEETDSDVIKSVASSLWQITGKNYAGDYKKWARWYNVRKKSRKR